MKQDLFNKLVTTALLMYAMVMYTLSWWLQKPLDLTGFMTLLAPILTHGLHLVSNKISDKAGSNGGGHKDETI